MAYEMNKVLIVDDDQFLLDGLSLSLRKAPYEVLTANSIALALDAMEHYPVDIVISDLCLPGASGPEFLRQCFRQWPKTYRIILSGHVNPEVALSAINDLKVYKFLTKPCPTEKLKTILEEIYIEQEIQKGTDDLVDIAMQQILGCLKTENPNKPSANNVLANSEFRRKMLSSLTKRELDVLEYLLKSYRVPRIAELLHISPHTARNHLKSIFNKLGVHSQAELIEWVISHTDATKK